MHTGQTALGVVPNAKSTRKYTCLEYPEVFQFMYTRGYLHTTESMIALNPRWLYIMKSSLNSFISRY